MHQNNLEKTKIIMPLNYLKSAHRQFDYYKLLGEKALSQLEDEALFYSANDASNSIAIIVQHLAGNMLSRWTNFLTEDGEKPWRERDEEFEMVLQTREEVFQFWEKGWHCLFAALESITEDDLERIIYIRNEGHTVLEAINRQIAHYSYHVGQIVYIAKLLVGENWKSLSIPKRQSSHYNESKFAQEKGIRHFTEEEIRRQREEGFNKNEN